MSRGIGTLQRGILAALEPTPECPTPTVCLADYTFRARSRYETARRALARLEARGMIEELLWWRLALCKRSKRYALPRIEVILTERYCKYCETRDIEHLRAPTEQLNVVSDLDQHLGAVG